MEHAAIDRFEGDWAVLLVGPESRVVNVPRAQLPKRARAGQWLQVTLQGDAIVAAELDRAETQRRRKRIREKLERLRRGEYE
jgi:hypothetical protein